MAETLEPDPAEDHTRGIGARGVARCLERELLSRFVLAEVVETPGLGERVRRERRTGDEHHQHGNSIRTHPAIVAHQRQALTP